MIQRYDDSVPDDVSRSLDAFERSFDYPLGVSTRFRVEHGPDHLAFFRALGEASIFLASREGRIVATACAAIRDLRENDRARRMVYLGALRLAPEVRRSTLLARLLLGIQAWATGRAASGYAVAMTGTAVLPDTYTGRMGITSLRPCQSIDVLTIPARGVIDPAWRSDAARGEARFAALSSASHASDGARGATVSRLPPRWLVDPLGRACCRLIDTELGKRLVRLDGAPLRALHATRLAWSDPAVAADLLRHAAAEALAAGHDTVFAAVPAAASDGLRRTLGATSAPAVVYAGGDPVPTLHIDSSEI